MTIRGGSFGLVAALLLGLMLAGCLDVQGCVGAQGYTGQSGVCNETNGFSFGKNVSMDSSSEVFTWENTLGRAEVHWGANAGMGSVTVTLEDADGNQVYQDRHASTGQKTTTQTSSPGTPGDWTVRIEFSGYTGQMGLAIAAV
jgi:hypothetical protein